MKSFNNKNLIYENSSNDNEENFEKETILTSPKENVTGLDRAEESLNSNFFESHIESMCQSESQSNLLKKSKNLEIDLENCPVYEGKSSEVDNFVNSRNSKEFAQYSPSAVTNTKTQKYVTSSVKKKIPAKSDISKGLSNKSENSKNLIDESPDVCEEQYFAQSSDKSNVKNLNTSTLRKKRKRKLKISNSLFGKSKCSINLVNKKTFDVVDVQSTDEEYCAQSSVIRNLNVGKKKRKAKHIKSNSLLNKLKNSYNLRNKNSFDVINIDDINIQDKSCEEQYFTQYSDKSNVNSCTLRKKRKSKLISNNLFVKSKSSINLVNKKTFDVVDVQSSGEEYCAQSSDKRELNAGKKKRKVKHIKSNSLLNKLNKSYNLRNKNSLDVINIESECSGEECAESDLQDLNAGSGKKETKVIKCYSSFNKKKNSINLDNNAFNVIDIQSEGFPEDCFVQFNDKSNLQNRNTNTGKGTVISASLLDKQNNSIDLSNKNDFDAVDIQNESFDVESLIESPVKGKISNKLNTYTKIKTNKRKIQAIQKNSKSALTHDESSNSSREEVISSFRAQNTDSEKHFTPSGKQNNDVELLKCKKGSRKRPKREISESIVNIEQDLNSSDEKAYNDVNEINVHNNLNTDLQLREKDTFHSKSVNKKKNRNSSLKRQPYRTTKRVKDISKWEVYTSDESCDSELSLTSDEGKRGKNNLFKLFPKAIRIRFELFEKTILNEESVENSVDSLASGLSDPSVISESKDVIYYIVKYLSLSQRQPILVFREIRDPSILFPLQESCTVSALFIISAKLEDPELTKVFVYTLHQVILAKDSLTDKGTSALCRVHTEVCKNKQNKFESIKLACDILKIKHKYSTLLIASIVSVWNDLFEISADAAEEETIFYGSISYGAEKEIDAIYRIEYCTCLQILREFISTPAVKYPNEIVGRVMKLIHQMFIDDSPIKEYMLTDSLVIFSAFEGWTWAKREILYKYVLPAIANYSGVNKNEKAFFLFCNLYSEICHFSPEGSTPEKFLLDIFQSDVPPEDNFIVVASAIASIRLLLSRKQILPDNIKTWMQENKLNPHLSSLVVFFQRKIMAMKEDIIMKDEIIYF